MSYLNGVFCHPQLRPGCISPLKNLRRLGILRIQDFFDNFDWYDFSPDECDAIFQAVVWPQACPITLFGLSYLPCLSTSFPFHCKNVFCTGGPAPHGEHLLPDSAVETHPFVVQKCQVRAGNVLVYTLQKRRSIFFLVTPECSSLYF